MSFQRRPVFPAIFRLMELAAAIILGGLMLITCSDVVARYFFNRPIVGGFEMTEALLACLIFIGLPLVTLRSDHIAIDILPIPARLAVLHHRVVNLLGALTTAFLAYRLWLRANQLLAAGEVTLQLGVPVAYVAYIMSVFTGLMALTFVIVAILPPVQRTAQVSEI